MIRLQLIVRAVAVLLCMAALVLLAGCGGNGVSSNFEFTLIGGDRQTIRPGESAVWTFKVTEKFNINSQVHFRVTGLPPGTTATLSPDVLPDTATESVVTIQTSASTPVGSYTVHFFAQEDGQSESGPVDKLLIINDSSGAPDFSLEVTPSSIHFDTDSAPTATFYIRPNNGFSGAVSIEVVETSDALTFSQPPIPSTITIDSTGGKGGTFVLSPTASWLGAAPTDVLVTARSGSIVHTMSIHVTFKSGGGGSGPFTLTVIPTTVNAPIHAAGGHVSIVVASVGTFAGTVNLSIPDKPFDLEALNFDPKSLTLAAGESKSSGFDIYNIGVDSPQTIPITVTATSGTVTKTQKVDVVIPPP